MHKARNIRSSLGRRACLVERRGFEPLTSAVQAPARLTGSCLPSSAARRRRRRQLEPALAQSLFKRPPNVTALPCDPRWPLGAQGGHSATAGRCIKSTYSSPWSKGFGFRNSKSRSDPGGGHRRISSDSARRRRGPHARESASLLGRRTARNDAAACQDEPIAAPFLNS